MIAETRRVEWRGITLSIAGIVAVTGITLMSLAGWRGEIAGDRHMGSIPQHQERTLPTRLAAIDEAIARKDTSRAVYEWRDAYGVALRLRRWDAMAQVGDAALKIDALVSLPAGHPTAFRAEARQAYLRALLDARAAGSHEGVERIAEAFAALGDTRMAAQARTLMKDR